MSTIHRRVALQGVRFFAFHGFYPEEQVTGCEFFVDAEVTFRVFDDAQEDLARTVNYERLYEIMAAEMKHPRKLLETVAHAILDTVRSEWLHAETIRVAIRKMHPPLPGEVDHSLVELTWIPE